MRLERHGEVCVLRMEGGKANAINPAFLEELGAQLDAFDGDPARALVLIGYDRFFSAGLDLVTLADFDRAAMDAFMERFDRTMLRVFCATYPVVAAVNGHAVAGGCVLAMQADRRVLAEGGTRFGVNETALGVGLPATVIEAFRAQVPAPSMIRACVDGTLFEPDEALALGLVHDVVPAEQVEARAIDEAARLGAIGAASFAHVKEGLRAPHAVAMAASLADDVRADWLDTWFSDDAQRLIGEAVAKLRG